MTNQTNEDSVLKIKRARLDSLNIYEISESELEIIEKGSPDSIYLNFSIFLLSTAVSFFITLLTVKIESIYTFIIFVVVTAIGFAVGLFLLILWFRKRRDFKTAIKKIRDRLRTE